MDRGTGVDVARAGRSRGSFHFRVPSWEGLVASQPQELRRRARNSLRSAFSRPYFRTSGVRSPAPTTDTKTTVGSTELYRALVSRNEAQVLCTRTRISYTVCNINILAAARRLRESPRMRIPGTVNVGAPGSASERLTVRTRPARKHVAIS